MRESGRRWWTCPRASRPSPSRRLELIAAAARSWSIAESVAQSAVGSVHRLGLKALVVPTTSGRTARILSAHRPNVPVLAISPRLETVRRMSLLFGVTAVRSKPVDDIRSLLEDCAAIAARHGVARSGELIGITAGLADQEPGTNLFEVHRVP